MLFFLLFFFFSILEGGVITPYGSKPIELSINNQNKISSYTFKFTLENDLLAGILFFPPPPHQLLNQLLGDYLFIYFPSAQYPVLPSPCSSSLLPEDALLYPTLLPLSCTLLSSQSLFKLTLPELKSGSSLSHSVLISGISNAPKGGTGNFRLESRRGDLNLIDYNHFFESVGLDASPAAISSFSVSRTLNGVNDVASYSFNFVVGVVVPMGGGITIDVEGNGVRMGGEGSSNVATKMSVEVKEKMIRIYVREKK